MATCKYSNMTSTVLFLATKFRVQCILPAIQTTVIFSIFNLHFLSWYYSEMLKLGRVTKVKVFFLVLVFIFNIDLFKFSATILEKGLFCQCVKLTQNRWSPFKLVRVFWLFLSAFSLTISTLSAYIFINSKKQICHWQF